MKKNKKQNEYIIEGTITDQCQQAVSGFLVEAYDWDPNTPENPLGKPDYTNKKGTYRITYKDEDFRLGGKEKGGADLLIRVYDRQGRQVGKSEIKFNASKKEELNLMLDKVVCKDNSTLDNLLEQFIDDKEEGIIDVGGAKLSVTKDKKELTKLIKGLQKRGIFSKEGLVGASLNDFDIVKEAKTMDVKPLVLASFINYGINSMPEKEFNELKRNVESPKFKGGIDLEDPAYKLIKKELRLDEIPMVTIDQIKEWRIPPSVFYRYSGPTSAVDLRPYLGDARSQGSRVTCTSFCATSIVEAMEYYRNPRNQPIDLSEELVFWYSKSGELYTAGGYSGSAALRHYQEFGGCEEIYLPYNGSQINSNHAHIPVPDVAIDRAQFFRNGEVVNIPARDVDAVKETLKTGRCVGISCDTHGWSSGTGQVSMPSPLDSKEPGAGHCVSIIGFIDRNDLDEDLGGGFFIVRNSWGGADSPTHLLGPEYGGHLLMPYGWYSRYAYNAFVMKDVDAQNEEEYTWLVEYYDNVNLRGNPIKKVRVRISSFLITEISVPTEIDELNFDWQSGSALQFEFPSIIDANSLPLKDNFSIRFTKLKRFKEGYYRFRLTGDDGVRLYIDDRLVINSWKNQAANTYTAEHYLTGGDHILKVEYYERTGRATVALEIEAIQFTYQIFNNSNLLGRPSQTFTDTRTMLEWRHAPPVLNAITPGIFSLRGEATLYFNEGAHRFHALHNGGCRMWVDNQLVLDDWNGDNGNGVFINIVEGLHTLRTEYKQMGLIPAIGSKTYYKAALHFGWSEEFWLMDFHHDSERWDIRQQKFPNPDSHYEAFRTLSLTGNSELQHRFPDTTTNPWRLDFNKIDNNLLQVIPAASGMSSDNLSLHIRRRIFVESDGYYSAKLESDDGYRLCVGGVQLLEDHHITGADPQNQDIWLKSGFHDLAVEYANTKWGGKLKFKLEAVKWATIYFEGTNFETLVEQKQLNDLTEVIPSLPTGMNANGFSIRANRNVWLPLGRYRFQLRCDKSVRLKVNGATVIDGLAGHGDSSYQSYYEHKGGELKFEVECYNINGDPALSFQILPEGFFGEYFRGTTLQKVPNGSALDRNVPIAYRFEPVIDFDWGSGNRLDRVGSNNFSARWRGKVSLPVGRYRIQLTADDGVRLFVGGRMVIDEWRNQNVTTHSKTIDLVGRLHDIRLEYFEQSGNAVCKLVFLREF